MKNKLSSTAAMMAIVALMIITVGVSMAVFTYSATGDTLNEITVGGITFHYEELDGKGRGISITDAMPVASNENAKTGDNYFNFKITSTTTGGTQIPYVVTARMDPGSDEILGDIIDIYLTDESNNPTPLFEGELKKYNELEQYDQVDGYTEKVIYTDTVTSSDYEKNFRLRMWIDQNTNLNTGNGTSDYNNKSFSVTVNVNAVGSLADNTNTNKTLAQDIKRKVDDDPTIPDPNDDNNKDNNDCDPSIDTTCHTCDPNTDPTCGPDNKKRDKCTDYENGICKTEDDDDDGDGEDDDIYYFRGGTVDNYVKFGSSDVLWRIIKINTSGGSESNLYYTNSSIKNEMNTWYNNNIVENDLDLYVASGKHFCQETKPTTENPTFDCGSTWLVNADVGLITLGEFLKVNNTFIQPDMTRASWTMTPKEYQSGTSNMAFNWLIYTNGTSSTPVHQAQLAAYPVVNLLADVQVTGTGKKTDPYVVVLNKERKTLTELIFQDNPVIKTNATLTQSSGTANEVGLYVSNETNSGEPTYFYRGDVKNNNVKFAGKNWKIVRVNEDGSVRMILYNPMIFTSDLGAEIIQFNACNTTAGYSISDVESCRIDTNKAKYMYYSTGTEKISDTIFPVRYAVEKWYSENITGKNDEAVVVGKYCEEAKVVLDRDYNSYQGTTFMTPLGVVNNYVESYDNYTSDFRCKTDPNGHGILNLKVGLMTYEEANHAGVIYRPGGNSDMSYYMKNSAFWLMSPAGIDTNNDKDVIDKWVVSGGLLVPNDGWSGRGLNPVINVKGNIKARGSGTSTNPYTLIIE